MNYHALDNIGYMLNGEYFQLNKNANISQETALKYFKTQGVIDGLVDDERLEIIEAGYSSKKKEEETVDPEKLGKTDNGEYFQLNKNANISEVVGMGYHVLDNIGHMLNGDSH